MNFKRLGIITALVATAAVVTAGGARQLQFARMAGNTARPAAPAVGSIAPAKVGASVGQAGAGVAQEGRGAVQSMDSSLPPLPPDARMIVKNGALGLAVADPEAALSRVDQVVSAEQGVITSQTVRNQAGAIFVNAVIQVPPERFEDTLARLRDLRAPGSHVLNDTVTSQDVTDQVIDLEAQLQNLKATRDAYNKLLERASSVTDIITLTREISAVQTRIDQLQGRQNQLSRRAAVSVIELSLSPVGSAQQPGTSPIPRPADAARQAWQALLAGLQGLAVVLIWLAILLPLPILMVTGGWLAVRQVSRQRRWAS